MGTCISICRHKFNTIPPCSTSNHCYHYKSRRGVAARLCGILPQGNQVPVKSNRPTYTLTVVSNILVGAFFTLDHVLNSVFSVSALQVYISYESSRTRADVAPPPLLTAATTILPPFFLKTC